MKFILTLFVMTICFSAVANEFVHKTYGDEIFVFTNRYGAVTFNHTSHQMMHFNCYECHPTFPAEFDDDISVKNAAHKTCKGCHKVEGGPKGCRECHIK